MEFRPGENPPSAWAAAAPVEGAEQFCAEARRGEGMRASGTRLGVELAVEDFAGESLGQNFQLFVKGRMDSGAHWEGLSR